MGLHPQSLVNLLAYMDLNPVRDGIVNWTEQYRWSSLGYHVQTGNSDNLLSMDFGMRAWGQGQSIIPRCSPRPHPDFPPSRNSARWCGRTQY